jgi:argininosuccinate synthase
MAEKRKVVLAYSGGLDTSVILTWLQEKYDAEVITFTADIGQGEEVEPARAKAQQMGVKSIHIEDLREEFSQCSVPMQFMKVSIYSALQLHVH